METLKRVTETIHGASNNIRGVEKAIEEIRSHARRKEDQDDILKSLLTGAIGVLTLIRAVHELRTSLQKRTMR